MIESAGFVVDQWNDLTDQAAALMGRCWRARPGPWACTPSFLTSPRRRGKLTAALASGLLRVIQAIGVAAEPR